MLRNFIILPISGKPAYVHLNCVVKLRFCLSVHFGRFFRALYSKLPLPVPSIQYILTQLHASTGLVFE